MAQSLAPKSVKYGQPCSAAFLFLLQFTLLITLYIFIANPNHHRIAIAAIPGVASFVFMWSSASLVEDTSDLVRVLVYAGLYSQSQTLLTVQQRTSKHLNMFTLAQCHHVPYSSLTMRISDNRADRDQATAMRMFRAFTSDNKCYEEYEQSENLDQCEKM